MSPRFILLAITLFALCSCGPGPTPSPTPPQEGDVPAADITSVQTSAKEDQMTLSISSSAFQDRGAIPIEYTCDGKDISPPLAWTGAPAGTASFALLVDDPDAPVGVWDHWVVFDLPPDATSLPAAIPAGDKLPGGGIQGSNGWRRTSYGGPCPPSGTHRYMFKLYALDIKLGLGPGSNKKAVEAAMQGHILANAQIIGTYKHA